MPPQSPTTVISSLIISWVYVKFHNPQKAIAFYYKGMIKNGIFQTNYTFPIVVKACAYLGLLREFEMILTHVVKYWFDLDLYVRDALMHIMLFVVELEMQERCLI